MMPPNHKPELIQMPEFTKDEALTFIKALRLDLNGKVGFKWFVDKLSTLSAYIESNATENEQLNAYIDWKNARDDYESYLAARHGMTSNEDGAK